MMNTIIKDKDKLVEYVIKENLPDEAVIKALSGRKFNKNLYVVAIGKAAWNMANAAYEQLGGQIIKGIVLTKYDHSKGEIPGMEIIEAGHPLSDENTIKGTEKVVELAKSLTADDELLFLISGGGSALFEKPLSGLTLSDIVDVNSQLLAAGADIVEMNVIRKRLSAVKAGRFAQFVAPASIFAIVLSDVLGDRLDSIASGPAYPDSSTVEDAKEIVQKYNLKLTPLMEELLEKETPKKIENVETVITGSVVTLSRSAAKVAREMGYDPYVICSNMNCEAREAGRLVGVIALDIVSGKSDFKAPCAIILGGETVVNLKGDGKGGRNQEIALAAAEAISGLDNVLIMSVGSDGTDGPTDAAGGWADGNTNVTLKEKGISIHQVLQNNDAYHALEAINQLIITGPTGTNVNDVTVILCK
jgi:hydroxypyruvate reductase